MSLLTDNKFLNTVATFVKLATSEVKTAADQIADLQEELMEYKKKEAAENIEKVKYELELRKLADALYDADFLTDEYEKKNFLRKAAEDPVYVARFCGKVCEAADVAPIGRPARVAAKPKEAQYDPVMAKAFGWNSEAIRDE